MYVVTGLTKMKSGICMSVYDTERKCYLRPIPKNLHFEPRQLQGVNLFSVVDFQRDNRIVVKVPPHTEDYPITLNSGERMAVIRKLNNREQLDLLQTISDINVLSIFGRNQNEYYLKSKEGYQRRYFVVSNTGVRSLGTVQVREVSAYLDQYNKVRITFTDNSGIEYEDVSYVNVEQNDWADRLEEYVIKLNKNIAAHRTKYIRLSLARGFKPNEEYEKPVCFLQVSNINCYN